MIYQRAAQSQGLGLWRGRLAASGPTVIRWPAMSGAEPSGTDAVRAQCEAVLRQNWREGVRATDGTPFAYTCPSPGHYPWQWYWDSCFTAIAWRHFDPARSAPRARVAARRPARGRLHRAHDLLEHAAAGRRRFTYNVTSPNAAMTASIQPPAAGLGVADRRRRPRPSPAIARHYDWLAANRDLDGDGLIWIVQPDESGLDASPQFDADLAPVAPTAARASCLLVRRNRRLGYDLRRIADAGGPVCCEVVDQRPARALADGARHGRR